MAYIKTNRYTPHFVQVPEWFISRYMPQALGGYTKVYLYLLMLSSNPPEKGICLEEVSKTLDMLYSEVIQALKYWNDLKVLSFKQEPAPPNDSNEECFSLNFMLECPVQQPTESEVSTKSTLQKNFIQQVRPEYSMDEINLYKNNSHDFSNLVKVAERYLGRLISFTDQKILYSFYDWLHMPFDLIEYLIEYCVSMNRTSMHYIEKVALSWVDEGILTLEQAKSKIAVDKQYFKILSALGSARSTLTPIDKKFISKWLDTYGFSMEIILAACEKAISQANKPSLNYVDSILTSWHNEKVKTLEDVKVLDKAFESKRLLNTLPTSSRPVSNRIAQFNTLDSHDWDFDEIEQLEREYIQRKLNGGS